MKACVGCVVSTSLNDRISTSLNDRISILFNDLEVIEQGRDDKLNDLMDTELRSARLSNRSKCRFNYEPAYRR